MLGASAIGTLFLVMLAAGAALFGGGYMLVALLRPYVVDQHGWLTAAQFVDGVAISQAVPGPIVTFAAFVGFAVAGVGGAAIAMTGIYLPSFLAVFTAAPLLERWRHVASVQAALRGVNAVAAGAILGAALALLRLAAPDAAAVGILLVALAAQLWLRVSVAWLIVAGLAAGIVKFTLGTL
jgi:chromate transporter